MYAVAPCAKNAHLVLEQRSEKHNFKNPIPKFVTCLEYYELVAFLMGVTHFFLTNLVLDLDLAFKISQKCRFFFGFLGPLKQSCHSQNDKLSELFLRKCRRDETYPATSGCIFRSGEEITMLQICGNLVFILEFCTLMVHLDSSGQTTTDDRRQTHGQT